MMATARAWLMRQGWPTAAFYVGWFVYFTIFWSNGMTVNSDGGMTAGHVNIWGDWAIHYTMGSVMAYRDLFLHSNPLLVGEPFKYPYFVNFLSALFIRAGAPFFASFIVPSYFFCLFAVFAVHRLFRAVLGSPTAAVAASLIFLLDGGLGFEQFIRDIAVSKTPLFTLFHPLQVYSYMAKMNVYWINVVESMFIPQRSFELGFPITCCFLAAVIRARGPRLYVAEDEGWTNRRHVFILGLAFGFTPIIHAHAFAFGSIAVGMWSVWDVARRRGARVEALRWWGALFAGMILVGVPVIWRFYMGAGRLSILQWNPGWYADDLMSWFRFWFKNWGPTLLCALIGLVGLAVFARGCRVAAVVFALPFLVFFAAANLVTFHPWIWDNTKFLIWAAVGFCALATVTVRALWRVNGIKRAVTRTAAGLLMIAMCLTGAIDVYRTLVPSLNRHEMYSNEDLFLADWAKKNTPVDSVWLTGDNHNNWLFNLTGRQAVETYIGWLWTQGYNYRPVDRDIETMYAHPTRDDLFRKYKINYMVIGSYETDAMEVDHQGFDRRFPVVVKTDHYRVYRYAPNQPDPAPIDRTAPRPALPLTAALKPGLVRRIYTGKYFFGKPLVKEGDSDINFNYNEDKDKFFPVPGSVEWEGFLRIPQEKRYKFSLASDDGAFLTLDGIQLIDNGGSHPVQGAEATVLLAQGYHHIVLRYFDTGGGAVLDFRWAPVDGQSATDSEGLFH